MLHLRTKFRNPAGKKITSPHARTHNIHRNGPAETVGENSRRRRNSFFLSFPKKKPPTQKRSLTRHSKIRSANFSTLTVVTVYKPTAEKMAPSPREQALRILGLFLNFCATNCQSAARNRIRVTLHEIHFKLFVVDLCLRSEFRVL